MEPAPGGATIRRATPRDARALALLRVRFLRELGNVRDDGEAAALLREGLRDGGLAADQNEEVLDEPVAVERLIEMLRPGDLGVILAYDVPAVLRQVVPRATSRG